MNFATGLALRAMFKINMACRDGFVSNGSVLEQYFSTVVANLGERRAHFFRRIFYVFDVCANVCQSFLIFLLSSPSFDHEDSDPEHERF